MRTISRHRVFFTVLALPVAALRMHAAGPWDAVRIEYPARGFVSLKPAPSWEHALIVGNGEIGALVPGNVESERIILSHEGLFLPAWPPKAHPPMAEHLDEIRRLTMEGKGRDAAELMVKVGKEHGFDRLQTTDPLIPAAVLEIEMNGAGQPSAYARSVDWETGESVVGWNGSSGLFHRRMFVSRPDNVAVLRIRSPDGAKVRCRLRLAQVPPNERDKELVRETIKEVRTSAEVGALTFETEFHARWPGALGGYVVASKVSHRGGSAVAKDGWLSVTGADEVLVLTKIELLKRFDLAAKNRLGAAMDRLKPSYQALLASHAKVHGQLFRRAGLRLGGDTRVGSEDLIARSAVGQTDLGLIERVFDAGRYNILCSTGTLPPTLQGIWGGTWRPAWSSDFTQDGNVEVAIASGLSLGFPEVTRSYLDYMTRLQGDFRINARKLYGAHGLWVPPRTSDHGQIIHYSASFPGLYWNAGAAWASQFYYDYWLYTGDRVFLQRQALPFMLDAAAFYEDFLTVERDGKYVFTPSYSPEIAPLGGSSTVVPNATMDVASVKQLLRNLIALSSDSGARIDPARVARWKVMLAKMPPYEVDESGSFREWLWPGLRNNDQHRHASHTYPLWYEVDPEISRDPKLIEGCRRAIENRMQYRRNKGGAEMAFGLTQLGLAAAHIGDAKLAYEAVEWMANRYWTTAFGSFHNPQSIFNTDVSGGLPAVIAELLLQSSSNGEIRLLPLLPSQWPNGAVNGLRARRGFDVDLAWKDGRLTSARVRSRLGQTTKVSYGASTVDVQFGAGETVELAPRLLGARFRNRGGASAEDASR